MHPWLLTQTWMKLSLSSSKIQVLRQTANESQRCIYSTCRRSRRQETLDMTPYCIYRYLHDCYYSSETLHYYSVYFRYNSRNPIFWTQVILTAISYPLRSYLEFNNHVPIKLPLRSCLCFCCYLEPRVRSHLFTSFIDQSCISADKVNDEIQSCASHVRWARTV